MAVEIPRAFVWTKMQAEAGQALGDIVRRKELERAAGNGLFFWGIGSALGEPLIRLIHRRSDPTVLFSIMRTPPKRIDSAPEGVFLWTSYVDASGRVESLPPHALVTSRSTTGAGDKKRHYALVCTSEIPLRLETLGALDASHLWNLGTGVTRVGSSQVTAVVEHGAVYVDDIPRGGPFYEVNMRAKLTAPYFVRLARPVHLPSEARLLLSRPLEAPFSRDEWLAFVHHIRALGQPPNGLVDEPDFFAES